MKSSLVPVLLAVATFALTACDKPAAPAPAKPAAPATPDSGVKSAFAAKFDGLLVDAAGKPAAGEALARAKYVAVYFSAHWCPPCRAFTPKFVEYTNTNRKDGNFEVIFVSSDRSTADMLNYMTETKMPWNGILSKEGKVPVGIADGITGIPHLRVFDAAGKVVIDTDYNAGVDPAAVLEKLKPLIAAN